MRVVLDTNVVIAGVRSPAGASRQLLLMALSREVELVLSVPLVLEYEAVLLRERGEQRGDVADLLDGLCSVCRPVTPRFSWRPILPDPNDEMVLEAALAGSVDCLVTHNVRDLRPGRQLGVRVEPPAEALRRIRDGEERSRG